MFSEMEFVTALEPSYRITLVALVLASISILLYKSQADKNNKDYPSGQTPYVFHIPGAADKDLGPPPLPILGNLHQFASSRTYLQFGQWAKQYGGMYMVRFGHKKTIVLTDRRLVKELMDKKHAVSSNRPHIEMLQTTLYKNDDLLLMQPSDIRWRTGRKFLHQNFRSTTVENTHMPLINAESTQLMKDFLCQPEEFLQHTKRLGNSFMMSVGYGIRSPDNETPHMLEIQSVLKRTNELLHPGTLPPIDIFPFLNWVPQGFFGNWRDKVDETRVGMESLYYGHLDLVAKRREREGRRECFADRLLEQKEELNWTWREMCFMAGLLMEAGSDTAASTVNTIIHLLCAHPEWAKKAQEQLDTVVGDDRSPVFADFEQLNIVNAIMKESLRMRPISPLGFPHSLKEDVWIEGKMLPKGSDIIVNIYGLHHDETRYVEPETFNPGRYLHLDGLADQYAHTADYEDRDHYAYGTGRRLCPGIHLAERMVFLVTAKLLWAFDFDCKLNSDGERLKLDISSTSGYSDGVVVAPNKFECDIRVRSETKKATIFREFDEAEKNVFPNFQVPGQ
ncbi:hypothetical protein VTL71DRAFT_6857 [Oculimacula yallundae]|uniref:Cytochrome P450 n=1 Tax=Oculimacula yallundae TaxID=86028 RepID=A0ABR4BV07_9HELO